MRTIVLVALLLLAVPCYGQQSSTAATQSMGPEAIFSRTLSDLRRYKQELDAAKAAPTPNDAAINRALFQFTGSIDTNLIEWVKFLAGADAVHEFLSDAERLRIDKQLGTGPNSNGTTSLVTKGSVPALIGLAVEHGAATREVDGTNVTFRVNPAGVIKALLKKSYLTSGPTNLLTNSSDSDLWYQILKRASFSISFDTSKGSDAGIFTGSRSQLAGYSGHLDIINHRDPRDKKNQPLWDTLRREVGTELANSLTGLADQLHRMPGYESWRLNTRDDLLAASPENVVPTLVQHAEQLRALINKDAATRDFIEKHVVPVVNKYALGRVGLLDGISHSFTLAFEYTNTRQVVTLGGNDSQTITLPPGVTNGLPDLGNFLLTAGGRVRGSEITANFSATRFNGRRPGPDIGRWRDVQFGVQVDFKILKRLTTGTSTLSFSYLFLDLLEEPLGAKILVNGVEESRTGIINFGQAKLDFAIGSTGMHVPISMTFSNRTELIKESDVRGHIGITFDLDKLFSKKQ